MKIMILSCYAPSVLTFRKDMIMEMKSRGHKVIVVAPESAKKWEAKFGDLGIKYVSVPFVDRTGINPIRDIFSLFAMARIIRKMVPDKIFVYHAKTIIYGSIAARLVGVKDIYIMMAGLGSVLRGSQKSLLRKILKFEYKFVFKLCRKIFCQNPDDCELIVEQKLAKPEQIQIVNGSGVNLNQFRYNSIQNFPVFLFVGRIIRDKGVMEYVKAAEIVKKKYPCARMQMVGFFDTNPTALQKEDIQDYIDNGVVEYFGYVEDVRPFLINASVFVLPSYHEGTPKSVLEAMAVGRPIITTNAPGCRETVIEGVNGFLVPVKNVDKLAEKMAWMIENKSEVEKMGIESMKICRKKYDVNIINKVILKTMNL